MAVSIADCGVTDGRPLATTPRKSLLRAEHGKVSDVFPLDEGYAETVLAEFTREGVDDEALAAELQREGAAAFAKSWNDLMSRIAEKSEALAKVNQA